MRLVYLSQCGASGTQLGAFLGALMRKFELPSLLFNLARSDMQSNYGKFAEWTEETKQELIAQLTEVERICKDSGLPAAKGVRGTIERIQANDKNFIDNLGHKISGIRNEIVAQLEQFTYLEIAHGDTGLFLNSRPFGDDVWTKFPDSKDDLEEAATCLALDRGTACVLHLARAMEHALRAFAKSLHATFKDSDDWQVILDEVDKLIKLMPATSASDMAKKDAYRQAHADLGRVKLAWRLPGMHSRGSWKPDQAREVYGSCRAFMKHVATVT